MTIPTLTDPDFPFYARDVTGNTFGSIRLDDLQRWTLLLDHLAHWLSRADRVSCDHYRRFAATSCSHRDTDLLDMLFGLTGITCRLDELVEGVPAS
jgi:hypothetical protein